MSLFLFDSDLYSLFFLFGSVIFFKTVKKQIMFMCFRIMWSSVCLPDEYISPSNLYHILSCFNACYCCVSHPYIISYDAMISLCRLTFVSYVYIVFVFLSYCSLLSHTKHTTDCLFMPKDVCFFPKPKDCFHCYIFMQRCVAFGVHGPPV